MESKTRPHVVIIGAGFGGLNAAQELHAAEADVTLIDKRNYHLFQPLLYQVATAGVQPGDIAYPVRTILRKQKNLDFRMTRATGVDVDKRLVLTRAGDIPYDYLIVAVGGSTNFFGLDSVAANGFGLKDIEDAVGLRNQILSMVERAMQEPDPDLRRAMLTFVVVGGGPTGVESAGALSELVRLVLVKDYPRLNIKEVRIILLEASAHLLAAMPERLQDITYHTLLAKMVEVRFCATVTDFDGEKVTLRGDEVIPARTLIWAAGVQAASFAATSGLALGSMRRIIVNQFLQVPEHPEIFVIGDAAHFEQDGRPLPMIAPVANQGAVIAAQNIRNILQGQPLRPFLYKDPGILATIGRNAAVAKMGNMEFQGFFAWILWLGIHVLRLVGFRNRLMVLLNWAWEYFFYERGVRAIMPNIEKQIKS
ncbi:NAD(P)/FAD-dependent oxidoreductase [Azotosporobacter soli]|uniref:NAD(P)/FAD-dependent oxidoreductase n=1 Tax=Azotosporobacter soli TaxID=3055040 RepID=UPI0031FE923F